MSVDIDAIKQRCDAATPGPWTVEQKPGEYTRMIVSANRRVIASNDSYGGLYPEWDDDFIAAARTDVPDLVAEVERLRAALEMIVEETDRFAKSDFRACGSYAEAVNYAARRTLGGGHCRDREVPNADATA